MQLVLTTSTTSPLIFKDNNVLYVIENIKGHYIFQYFETTSFQQLGQFQLKTNILTSIIPVADNDCIYFATADGVIVGIDKFAGHQLINCELGAMWCTDKLYVDDQFVYGLCSIPINFKTHIGVCICDKRTGIKKYQTKTFESLTGKMTVTDKIIYLVSDSLLTAYDSNANVWFEAKLDGTFYDPVPVKNQIYVFSPFGMIKVFDKISGHEFRERYVAQNEYPPIFIEDFYWFTYNGIYKINPDMVMKINTQKLSQRPILHNNNIYICEQKDMIQFNPENNSFTTVKKEQDFNEGYLFSVGDHLLFIRENELWNVL